MTYYKPGMTLAEAAAARRADKAKREAERAARIDAFLVERGRRQGAPEGFIEVDERTFNSMRRRD